MAELENRGNIKLRSLFHDPDYYTKTFHAYAKRSAKFQVLAKWADNVFPAVVIDKLVASLPASETIRMLGIGSGSGEMDSKMAASIKTKFHGVHNNVLEPAGSQLEMYRQLVEQKRDDFCGIEFDLRQETIDQYRDNEKQAESGCRKYHFISAIHSIYYADDYDDTIGYLYNCLEEGGVLLLIVVADDSGFWHLWDQYSHFQDVRMKYLNNAHIRDSFDKRSIRYETHKQKSRVEITSCFDDQSEEGNLIVDFLSHVINIRESAPPALYREVIDFMGSDRCSERFEDGTVLFNNDWAAVIAQKPVSK